MKINVTVDLSDFYSEDETSFSQQIKDYIAYSVKTQVLADWKVKISDEFNKAVTEQVELHKKELISNTFAELAINAKVKKRYASTDMISISEWIVEEFERTTLNDSYLRDHLNKTVKASSDKISTELKNRYDMLFASHIVAKLNENGMLKEDVAKMLIDATDKK